MTFLRTFKSPLSVHASTVHRGDLRATAPSALCCILPDAIELTWSVADAPGDAWFERSTMVNLNSHGEMASQVTSGGRIGTQARPFKASPPPVPFLHYPHSPLHRGPQCHRPFHRALTQVSEGLPQSQIYGTQRPQFEPNAALHPIAPNIPIVAPWARVLQGPYYRKCPEGEEKEAHLGSVHELRSWLLKVRFGSERETKQQFCEV